MVVFSLAGWRKYANSIDDLTGVSPDDALEDWQAVDICDSSGNLFRSRRAYRVWPVSSIGAFMCKWINHVIYIDFDFRPPIPMTLDELEGRLSKVGELPDVKTWDSHRQLLRILCD